MIGKQRQRTAAASLTEPALSGYVRFCAVWAARFRPRSARHAIFACTASWWRRSLASAAAYVSPRCGNVINGGVATASVRRRPLANERLGGGEFLRQQTPDIGVACLRELILFRVQEI